MRPGKGAAMRTNIKAASCNISYLSHVTQSFGGHNEQMDREAQDNMAPKKVKDLLYK